MNTTDGIEADLHQMNSVPGVFLVKKELRAGIEKFSQLLANEGVLRMVFDESQIDHAIYFSELEHKRRQAARPGSAI
jgi:hypothetical protein